MQAHAWAQAQAEAQAPTSVSNVCHRHLVIVTMPTARLLLMYLMYIVRCGRTYYTGHTLTRPVVIVL